ncbi:hypothetical protein Tco_1516687 [Tanacetum coccineum]
MHQAFNQKYDLDDEFDPLFGQPSEGPSQPVEDKSPVEEVAPVKMKYVRRRHPGKKNDKDLNSTHIALNLNDEASDSEDVEVQKIRPIGRDRAKKKGSSSASRSSSSVSVDPNLVDTLLSKFRKVLTPLFSSRKESSSEHLRIKER